MAQGYGQGVGSVGRLWNFFHGKQGANKCLDLAFVGVSISGDGSFDFARRVAENFQVMLRGGEEHDATDFGEAERRFYVESREDGFDGDGIWRKFLNEIAKKGVNRFERGARGKFALVGNAQRAIVQRATVAALRFDDGVTGRAGGRRIDTQDAEAADFSRRRHVGKSKARGSRTQSS